ncbi:hypothetical protein [Candidatus Phytoplasma pini]|uniref:Uncharacterized protein n=1 Tax=Candidatus Phytoplasma pini TaxID=267362 RepID=A0A559KJH6_9MOLU|nr:hypothetical protein [Candidatus Phytoplasma pini]TVY12270.1 hypothetical protein MDPP_00217 [Candidatus Phytoplasma pini]
MKKNFTKNIFKIAIFLIIILFLSITFVLLSSSEKKKESKQVKPKNRSSQISSFSVNHLKKETQVEKFRYDFFVKDEKEINLILHNLNIKDTITSIDKKKPFFNDYENNKHYFNLKNNSDGLLYVHLKPNKNSLHSQYLRKDDKYTLQDLLEEKRSFENIFVFWDIEKSNTFDISIHHVITDLPFNKDKKQFIKEYLEKQKIFLSLEQIHLNCYNPSINKGIVEPLGKFAIEEMKPTAIYYDDGIRFINNNNKERTNTEFYQRHNGAKNIYVFKLKNKKQNEIQKNEYQVENLEEMKKILNQKNIYPKNINIVNPSFNKNNIPEDSNIEWYIKNPSESLFGVYFKYFENKGMPSIENFQYSLEDLLKNNDIIEEAYIFYKKRIPSGIKLFEKNKKYYPKDIYIKAKENGKNGWFFYILQVGKHIYGFDGQKFFNDQIPIIIKSSKNFKYNSIIDENVLLSKNDEIIGRRNFYDGKEYVSGYQRDSDNVTKNMVEYIIFQQDIYSSDKFIIEKE